MESKIIYHIEKFIIFLLGKKNENDPDQQIYNKLLELDGDELEAWVNGNLKKYITGRDIHSLVRNIFECKNVKFVSRMSFKTWYNYHIDCESDEVMDIREIYGNSGEEYNKLREKLQNYQMNTLKNVRILTCELDFIINYIEMIVMETNCDVLKAFIIEQVDPVEIR